jgi:hypothetical protein
MALAAEAYRAEWQVRVTIDKLDSLKCLFLTRRSIIIIIIIIIIVVLPC